MGAVADIFRADQRDGERHQRIDILSVGTQDAGDRETQREAVSQGETGDDEQQIAHAP